MSTQELLKYFALKWKEKYGHSYTISYGRDGKILKTLLADHSYTDLQKYIRYYLTKYDDSFVRENGHVLTLLRTSLPKIVAAIEREQKAKPELTNDFERLEAARERLK